MFLVGNDGSRRDAERRHRLAAAAGRVARPPSQFGSARQHNWVNWDTNISTNNRHLWLKIGGGHTWSVQPVKGWWRRASPGPPCRPGFGGGSPSVWSQHCKQQHFLINCIFNYCTFDVPAIHLIHYLSFYFLLSLYIFQRL